MIGTCLFWTLLGGLFARKFERITDDRSTFFIPKRHTFSPYPTNASDAEGKIKKRYGTLNTTKHIMKTLIIILTSHEKSALSCKINYGCEGSSLESRVPLDKFYLAFVNLT